MNRVHDAENLFNQLARKFPRLRDHDGPARTAEGESDFAFSATNQLKEYLSGVQVVVSK